MTSEREVYGIASIYIREHGDDAVIEAAMRADALLDAGDLEGHRRRAMALYADIEGV